MTRTTPPFRADHVGSLLRPAALKEARARRERGEISAADLRAVEDAAIEHIIARQAEIGLRSATDGEFRRAMWHFDFLERLDGVESFRSDHGIAFKGGIETQAKGLRVTGKIGFSDASDAGALPLPARPHACDAEDDDPLAERAALPRRTARREPEVYPEMEEFYRDLALAYRGAVQAFADAGCRYLQLDEVNLAYLCDPEQRQMLRDRGDDPDRLPGIYADMINTAIAGRPADMADHHAPVPRQLPFQLDRAGRLRAGGRTAVQPDRRGRLLHGVRYRARRRLRAAALRARRTRLWCLGLVTSKSGALESADELERRIGDAARTWTSSSSA